VPRAATQEHERSPFATGPAKMQAPCPTAFACVDGHNTQDGEARHGNVLPTRVWNCLPRRAAGGVGIIEP
jgi:hypothetical protein